MSNNPKTLSVILIMTHLVAFIVGVALVNYANSPAIAPKAQVAEVSEANPQIAIDYNTMKEQYEKMNERITFLENQNMDYTWQITSLGTEILERDTEISNLKSEIKSLKNDIIMLNFILESQNNKTSNEIVQNNSIVIAPEPTPPAVEADTVYTPYMSYPPYGSRGTMPYPTAYATVTPNVVKFSSGLSIEEIVNKIRFNISYLDHKTDGYPYMIQYADETLVRGKGDCTDKALLLFSCLVSKGYSVNDMGIAAISKCDGQALHDVIIIKNLAANKDNFGKYHFDVDGETFYILDPTNSLSTNAYEVSPQYKDCLIVGNLYFYDTNKGKGWMPYKIQ
ncbi:MAG TPA: hypothetical protein HA367_03355 [Candidatus Methanofastidiosum sp.]|nr:hypothetical protein [Methanofastidiosum sp.]